MIFIYHKDSKHFVGMATRVFDNGTWREASVEELYPNLDPATLGVVQVEDSHKYSLNPDGWRLKIDANGEVLGVERKPSLPKILLSTDAVDSDGDGIPELTADGKSTATITVEVKDARDNLVTRDLLLEFKTTGGILSARRVSTSTGQASVTITASVETVSVIVSVSAEGVKDGSIAFELMPPTQ